MHIKHILLGKALRSDQLSEQKLSRTWGLPIMSSDAISSVAYAVEEILHALVPFLGLAAVAFVGVIGVPIVVLLLLLIFSYTQIINHYPNGGGSYTVSKERFGNKPAILAATCLIVDYIMTVAVSISSSTAAIIAAFPVLAPYPVYISIFSLIIITLINLRGASESSKIFGVPTYAFIFTMIFMIVVGFAKIFMGTVEPITYTASQVQGLPAHVTSGITILLFLKAFSSGCSALTGVEAVSNAVPSFQDPPQRKAKHVLFMMGGCIFFIFGGTTFLASALKVIPMENTTVMAQMAEQLFGKGFFFFLLQTTTALILLLAANTAFNGLPPLLSILSRDRYMPEQFNSRGTKLSFSNGILFVSFMSAFMLIIFRADVNRLIPFYAVGVFVSFTLAQAGMFMKWVSDQEKGWQYKSIINLVGALITLIGTVVIFSSKFMDGAWMLLIAMPLIAAFMAFTHHHYMTLRDKTKLEGYAYDNKKYTSTNEAPVIVLVHLLNRGTIKALNYAKNISCNITCLHLNTTQYHTDQLLEKWKELEIDIPLEVIDAPFRDIITPLNEYITEKEHENEDKSVITVVLTKYVQVRWFDNLFHNQTTYFIERKLATHAGVATVLVPYLIDRAMYEKKNG